MRVTGHLGNSGEAAPGSTDDAASSVIRARLGTRSIVLVGMMGAGKTSTGRRLAAHLGLDFIDSDCEIETAAGMTISEIFARHGEPYFRDRESRVVARVITGGPKVVATGGGAFIHPATRAAIRSGGLSVWIKAEFDVLMRRVRKRNNRPLLKSPDPEGTLRRLMDERYPTYAEADITIVSRDCPHETMVTEVAAAIAAKLVGADPAAGARSL